MGLQLPHIYYVHYTLEVCNTVCPVFRLGSEEVCTSSKYVCVTCVLDHVTVGGHTYQLYETADLNIYLH